MNNSDNNDPSYYVGIGASAGGLEALQEIVQRLPNNSGAAFIIVQHLSPDFKSVMDELLGRLTDMPVVNTVDGVRIEKDTIYLIPASKNMMAAEGKLLLVDQMPNKGMNFPIDIFFRSLAEDQHHRSIAIVLSGTGTDGSRGISAIKEVGGLVIVQEPDSAKFNGMPFTAVKTGLADFVVIPEKIPEKIIQYITHPLSSDVEKSLIKNIEDSDGALLEIFSLLKENSEIDFAQYKSSTVFRRIERRITINGLESLQEYHTFLLKNPREISILAKDMLIGVTRFFRDSDAFDTLEKKIIPDIIRRTPRDEPIRVWVAGCSSGEEAYSIAILFDEGMQAQQTSREIKIFATDVDPDAISEASAGQFNINARDDISEDRLRRYFTEKEDYLLIAPEIRQMVVFATHNLTRDPPFSNTQLSICRNVLIYFQPKTQQRILSMLHFSLQKNGYLFLGSSETLGDLKQYFSVIGERERIYQKLSNARIAPTPAGSLDKLDRRAVKTSNVDQIIRNYQQTHRQQHNTTVLEQLVADYSPPCIVLDNEYNVLHVYGDVGKYTQSLKSGRFSANINDFILPELATAVSTALSRAVDQEDNVQYDQVQYRDTSGTTLSLSLRVRYIRASSATLPVLALLFSNREEIDNTPASEAIVYDIENQNQQRILDLETQLKKKQEHLQVTVEELETTNEELQSSNEELLAANEELQSTNEELQSVNEELYTVNSEFQEKIDELTRAHNDLDKILKSIDMGIIFLDTAMLIRKYSPAATKFVNLLPSDVGRPFHHISHDLDYTSLLHDISYVIDTNKSIEKQVAVGNEEHVLINIVPYYSDERVSEGCVLTLTDVTEIKRLEGRLYESYDQLRGTINSALLHKKKPLRILIVDDDQDDAFLIEKALRNTTNIAKNYEIFCVNSYQDAIKTLSRDFYDICFLDFVLDQNDAFALIHELGSDINLPGFILLSGALREDMYQTAIEHGVYDVIDKKDLSPLLLEKSVRHTLRHKETEIYLSQQQNTIS